MQAVILAGGLGTRVAHIAQGIPKSLIPINGRPFVSWQLDWLRDHGVDGVVQCVGHLGEEIAEVVGNGSLWGLKVTYSYETPGDLRGTAGAIRLAADRELLDNEFVVVYGDSYLDLDLVKIHAQFKRCGHPALMVVYENRGRFDRSNVIFDGATVQLYDKVKVPDPRFRYIDYGASWFRHSLIVREIPPDLHVDLSKLQHDLSLSGRLAGFLAERRFYEVGSESGIRELEGHLGKANLSSVDGKVY